MKWVLSVIFGAGVTAGLFLGIAQVGHRRAEADTAPMVDVREAVLPEEPPPPPTLVRPLAPAPVVPLGIENTTEESPLKIAVPPPLVDELLPPSPPAPPALVEVGDLAGHFKPSIEAYADENRIYQTKDVDQIPRVLDRTNPSVSSRVRGDADSLRVVVIVLIDATGVPMNPRLVSSSGNDKFDRIMLDCIEDWTFSPAVKHGRRVRCLVQQSITVMWTGGGNLFSL